MGEGRRRLVLLHRTREKWRYHPVYGGSQHSNRMDQRHDEQKFRIIVQVEASECMDGNQGFVENEKSNYSESFEVWSVGYEKNTGLEISSEGNMKVEIHEYELNSDGKRVPYENDKVILPGQEISKIVEFELTKKTIASDIPTGDISILAPAAATAAAVLSIGILTGIKVKKSRRGGNSSCGKGL